MNYICYMATLISDIHTIVTRLTMGIFSLKGGVESFYEFMQDLANYKVNPLIVAPLEPLCILLDIKQKIHLQP